MVPASSFLWFVALVPSRVALASDVNGVTFHYTAKGMGNPLVLAHPFGACGDIFAPSDASLSS
jgi:pimeloyl-ACP methyl ester carboxylesterase